MSAPRCSCDTYGSSGMKNVCPQAGALMLGIEQIRSNLARVTKERAAALANVARLREVLTHGIISHQDSVDVRYARWRIDEALAATPANALGKIEARVLREAADWFDDKIERRLETWQAQELRRMADAKEKA